MPHSADMSFWGLISQASVFVQLIMLLLVLLSMYSWWCILTKQQVIGRARKASQVFEEHFWSGAELSTLYKEASQQPVEGVAKVFVAGFAEFLKQRRAGGVQEGVLDSSRRAMLAANQRELDRLEALLPTLATIGSVSPYIGLLGTVWGIMTAFMGLSQAGQSTLASVAPGIAEALIATAIGLFAAIPAVVGYNRYVNQIDRLSVRMDSFIDEFSNILQRQGAAK